MTNLPLVSVLMPAYNHEKYVQESINSVVAQTYKNIELIVIDDGSKDNTWQKIQEMKTKCEERFVRVHVETKPNEGLCTTLNRLISLAKGDFIYLLASDDNPKPHAIETEVNFMQNNPDYVLVVGDNEFINSNSQRIGWDKHHNSVELSEAVYKTFGQALQNHNKDIDFNSSRFGLYETFVTRNYIPNGFLIPIDAMKKVGGYTKEAPLEDWYLHMQLSKIGKYKYIDDVLLSYRWHDNNTVKNKEYMLKISTDTQKYEEKVVKNLDDKKWYEIYMQQICQIKMKFNLFNVIKYYSLKNIDNKQYIIELCGRKFIIRTYEDKKQIVINQ